MATLRRLGFDAGPEGNVTRAKAVDADGVDSRAPAPARPGAGWRRHRAAPRGADPDGDPGIGIGDPHPRRRWRRVARRRHAWDQRARWRRHAWSRQPEHPAAEPGAVPAARQRSRSPWAITLKRERSLRRGRRDGRLGHRPVRVVVVAAARDLGHGVQDDAQHVRRPAFRSDATLRFTSCLSTLLCWTTSTAMSAWRASSSASVTDASGGESTSTHVKRRRELVQQLRHALARQQRRRVRRQRPAVQREEVAGCAVWRSSVESAGAATKWSVSLGSRGQAEPRVQLAPAAGRSRPRPSARPSPRAAAPGSRASWSCPPAAPCPSPARPGPRSSRRREA